MDEKPYLTNCPRCHAPMRCDPQAGTSTFCPNGCGQVYMSPVGPAWVWPSFRPGLAWERWAGYPL
jgi:hypothetical protein